MVLMIDNYDSFTYNLVQYFMELGEEVRVFRNDKLTPEQAEEMEFDFLVISPGPGGPADAGYSLDMVERFKGRKPILGVCLGHQVIGAAFGGEIVQAGRIMHGKADMVNHDGKSLFAGMPNPLRVIRYHSLAVAKDSLPPDFEISASSGDGEIMAMRHKSMRIEGVQFHPESIGTEAGRKMLANFLSGVRELPPLRQLLRRVVEGGHLNEEEAGHVMEQMTAGAVTQAQMGAFLTALTIKGPTVDELTGFVRLLRSKASRVRVSQGINLTDTCGTGGDSSGTFNISTAAAFVACGAGAAIAKHGNRSITSRAGSADVLEKLGVRIDLGPEQAAEVLEETGICFMFAPGYHPAFKHIMGPRRELGFRTVFNLIGPLLNPAGAAAQVMGVFDDQLTELVGMVLARLGTRHALVVHGSDGLDELTLTGPSRVTEVRDGWVRSYSLDPLELGLEYCTPADLKGGDPGENAEIIRRILSGEKGPRRDIVVLNAAAAIVAAGVASDFQGGMALARAAIDSGSALARLESLIRAGKEEQPA